MPVVGCVAINRPQQIELLDDFSGLEIENFPDCALQFFLIHFAGAESINANTHWLGVTDGISELDFASIRQAGCDDILGDPAAHVSCAAIYLRRVFSGKRSAAVPSHSAVAITDNLAPGDSSIAFRAADDEPASRVNQIGCFV